MLRTRAARVQLTNLERLGGLSAPLRRRKLGACIRDMGQFCPVALAAEVLAERWTLLIVRELLNGAERFNEIRRGVPRLSPTLLKQRLETLVRSGIVVRSAATDGIPNIYRLTEAGLALTPVDANTIGEWGQRWARDLKPPDLDPAALVWAIHRRLNTWRCRPAGPSSKSNSWTPVRTRDASGWCTTPATSMSV